MVKPQLMVKRISGSNGKTSEAAVGAVARQLPTARLFFQGLGGVGGRVVTHLKALDLLAGQVSGYAWTDSDRGDRFETTLPGGVRVALADSEICRFGVENTRTELEDYPQLARRYRRLLRGIPVALTFGHGAGQWRPIGCLDYEMDLDTIQSPAARALDSFYPALLGKRKTMAEILAEREADVRRKQPLLVVVVSSSVGGLGSSIFIHHAYLLRHLLEKRGAADVTLWGVLVGPGAFRGRGPNIAHNFSALMHELDLVYRDGFRHTFANGETVKYARPPFELLFQVDLTDWPEGEDPGGKLSDTAMDAFLRHTALGIHLLATPAMRDRLQSLLVNIQNREDAAAGAAVTGSHANGRLELLSSFNASLAAVNLNALDETLALAQASQVIQALIAQCGEES